MPRKFSDEQIELAKLAYPLFSNGEISEYIGCSKVWVEKLGQKYKLKKMNYMFSWGQSGMPIDLLHEKFGKLTVVGKADYKSKNNTVWICECKCGHTLKLRASVLRKGNRLDCGRCVKVKLPTPPKVAGNNWYWSKIKSHAQERGIAFNVDIAYLVGLFEKQKRKCAVSGLDIEFPMIAKNIKSGTASLDRKNSDKPYQKGNVQWVHKDIQFMKWKFDQKKFVGLCDVVSKFQGQK